MSSAQLALSPSVSSCIASFSNLLHVFIFVRWKCVKMYCLWHFSDLKLHIAYNHMECLFNKLLFRVFQHSTPFFPSRYQNLTLKIVILPSINPDLIIGGICTFCSLFTSFILSEFCWFWLFLAWIDFPKSPFLRDEKLGVDIQVIYWWG